MKSIGIIGLGRFGQLMAHYLKGHFDVYVSNRSDKSEIAKYLGVHYVPIGECATKDIVVPCVPISHLKDVLLYIAPLLKEGSLVFDVCSVKLLPSRWMEEILPNNCSILCTHPLFGPDTTKKGLDGKMIALCPVRGVNIAKVQAYMTELGLVPIVSTPEEHDKQMAKSLALIHFLGNALDKIDIDEVRLATKTHEKLKELVKITKNDSKELFMDMHKYNPFVSSVRKELINNLLELDEFLDNQK